MRRRIVMIPLLLLVLGAIVNVAVAWALSFAAIRTHLGDWIIEAPSEHPSPYAAAGVVVEHARGAAFADVIVASYGEGWRVVPNLKDELPAWIGTFLTEGALVSLQRESGVMRERCIQAAGWPCFSMGGSFVTQWQGPITNAVIVERNYAIASPRRSGQWAKFAPMSHMLPLRPLWPGFAINTIFYAAILWVAFFAPGKLKRTRRRRRGLCPACAYPIGTSSVCTECGADLNAIGLMSSATMGSHDGQRNGETSARLSAG